MNTIMQQIPETKNKFPLTHAAKIPRQKANKPTQTDSVASRIAGNVITAKVI